VGLLLRRGLARLFWRFSQAKLIVDQLERRAQWLVELIPQWRGSSRRTGEGLGAAPGQGDGKVAALLAWKVRGAEVAASQFSSEK